MKASKTVAEARKTPARRTSVAKPKRRPAAKKKGAKPVAPKPKVAKRKVVRRVATVKLPPILLEGDFPEPPPVSGPGQKYALRATPSTGEAQTGLAQLRPGATGRPVPATDLSGGTTGLPEAYGTQRLFLTARDPHWLYASWDLTREQQARFNRQSVDGHLVLRIHFAPPEGGLALELHVHPESRHWFAHVERAATKYTAELGYYGKGQKWASVARSGATLTPAETLSDDTGVEFATIPADLPFPHLLALMETAVQTHEPLARAVDLLRREGHPELPAVGVSPAAAWTPAQERALAEVVSLDHAQRVWIGSMEITELLRRNLERPGSSPGVAPGGAVTSAASPFGSEPPRTKGFWLNVNAELIIYGATEQAAAVTIGGRRIKLRPDGSFSYRFALPDGRYDLPVVAVSADKTDARGVELKFTRATEIRGDVGASPQAPSLGPPTPDKVA